MFLKAANIEFDEDLVNTKVKSWWWNIRDKDIGGLRLNEEGLDFVINEADIKTYPVLLPHDLTMTPQILIWLDNFIESPYFISKKEIIVIKEKTAFELYLFSGDIRKMGLSKAMAKQIQN